ncbi:MAG TPA: hypothetical protein VGK47_11125 [Nitrososphaeraceae archaeon]
MTRKLSLTALERCDVLVTTSVQPPTPALGRDWRLSSESRINTKIKDLSKPQEDKGESN